MPGLTDVVRSKTILVARWAERPERQEFNPDPKVWMVKADLNPPRSTQIYFKEGCNELRMMKYHYGKHLDDLVTNFRTNGFVNGLPLEKVAIPIQTCGSAAPGDDDDDDGSPRRPPYVYRVVHDEHPHGGIKARGFGLPGRQTAPLLFQIRLQRNLKWACREPSQFMSVMNSLEKAIRICVAYYARRMKGIRLLKIRTSGPGWKHWDMKMWHYYKREWVTENEIPEQAVVEGKSVEQTLSEAEMEGAKEEYLLAQELYEGEGETGPACKEEEDERKVIGEDSPRRKDEEAGSWIQLLVQ